MREENISSDMDGPWMLIGGFNDEILQRQAWTDIYERSKTNFWLIKNY